MRNYLIKYGTAIDGRPHQMSIDPSGRPTPNPKGYPMCDVCGGVIVGGTTKVHERCKHV